MKKFIVFIITIGILVVVFTFVLKEREVLPTVPLLAEYPEKVVYTTDATAGEVALRSDCAERGGRFNTCGSMCAPNAEVCATVCAYTCEFSDDNGGWKAYDNEELGFHMEYPEGLDVLESEDSRGRYVNFSIWGPTQIEGSEFYDGIGFSVTRLQLTDQTLIEYALEEEAILAQIGKVTSPLTIVVLGDRVWHEFTGVSVGAPQRRIFLPVSDKVSFEISVLVGDPTDQGYEVMAERMIQSLRFLN